MGPKEIVLNSTLADVSNEFATKSGAATNTLLARSPRRQELLEAETAAEDFTYAEIVRKSLIAMITKGYSNASQNISSLVQAA